ncbi:T9SS type A sorting domain-containing protein [Spirosoma agri]|uniref:T9SS type A sorting domain-containing protein n=1 Tax=Spirosoma agri TaxID=1987381 RepID=A0A6M0IP68_9BACT|nr:T9SS type A sorting domain-containing protein [Spirosoma agri]NEU70048.1 T9SS type A sorting domain-containing protein [Spirosoma agri]
MKNQYWISIKQWCVVALWVMSLSISARAQTGQPPAIQWQRVIENSSLSTFSTGRIAKANDGDFCVVSGTQLTRLSAAGTIVWSSVITGYYAASSGYFPKVGSVPSLAATSDGGFVVLVNDELFWSISKFDANGQLAWKKLLAYKYSGDKYESGITEKDLIATPDGGYLIVGDIIPGNLRFVIATKLDRDGNQIWQRPVSYLADDANVTINVSRVVNSPDGGYVLVGQSPTRSSAWASKLDDQGNIIWQKLYPERKLLDDVIPSPYFNGLFVASGVNNLNDNVSNTLNLGADGSPGGGFYQPGRLSFSRSSLVAVPARNGKPAYQTVLDEASQQAGDFRLTNLAQSDQLVWTKTFGGSGIDVPQGLIVTDDGSYVVVGTTTSTDGDVQGKVGTQVATWIVKVGKAAPANPLTLIKPTYDCATGSITFNITGGDESPITYNAPGITRARATDNVGVVEQGLRNDPKPITITATQSGQTASYTFDLIGACTNQFKPPVLVRSIPDMVFTVGQVLKQEDFNLGNYIVDPTSSQPRYFPEWTASMKGLPAGIRQNTFGDLRYNLSVSLVGAPTVSGVYTVTATAATQYFVSQPVITTFKITVTDASVVNPPTVGTLALLIPTYDCTTGAITFNTTGGNGSPITYSAPGITRSSLASNTGVVEQGLRNDPKPITITATQSGQTASYTFDFGAFCSGNQPPQPPITPPTTGALTLLSPVYDCASGAFTFKSSGGDNSPIEYQAAGITGWTTNPNQFVDKDSRTASDVKPFTLMARQSGQTVTYTWDLKVACGRSARVAAAEAGQGLRLTVKGNPVDNTAIVVISGVEGQAVQLDLLNANGHLLEQRHIEQVGAVDEQRFDVQRQPTGMLFLRAQSGQQKQTIKLIKQ